MRFFWLFVCFRIVLTLYSMLLYIYIYIHFFLFCSSHTFVSPKWKSCGHVFVQSPKILFYRISFCLYAPNRFKSWAVPKTFTQTIVSAAWMLMILLCFARCIYLIIIQAMKHQFLKMVSNPPSPSDRWFGRATMATRSHSSAAVWAIQHLRFNGKWRKLTRFRYV